MNKEQARITVDTLSLRFGIRPPSIQWTWGKMAKYMQTFETIIISPEVWTGVEHAILHEFAHHLDYCKNSRADHKESFRECLLMVTAEYYGNCTKYNWNTMEYKAIKNWWNKIITSPRILPKSSGVPIRDLFVSNTCAALPSNPQ